MLQEKWIFSLSSIYKNNIIFIIHSWKNFDSISSEVRAWTIKKGTKAPEAAGKIHSDIQRGFIKAEVVSYDDLIKEGSMVAAKEKGLVRSEGKEYVMQDGDIVLFKFNVSK